MHILVSREAVRRSDGWVINRINLKVHGRDVGVYSTVIHTVCEARDPREVLRRREGEGAVSVEDKRSISWVDISDDRCGERVAISIRVIGRDITADRCIFISGEGVISSDRIACLTSVTLVITVMVCLVVFINAIGDARTVVSVIINAIVISVWILRVSLVSVEHTILIEILCDVVETIIVIVLVLERVIFTPVTINVITCV